MQVVTITFFRLSEIRHKLWALAQMQLAARKFRNTPGLTFHKLLGSGSGNGFEWYPDFSVYTLVCVWKAEDDANTYFESNTFYKTYRQRSEEAYTVYMHTIEAHGLWSGINPFERVTNANEKAPIAVLTRATIKTSKVWAFWRKVSAVSHSMKNYEGKLFAKGVGEWPIFQQATFTMWLHPEHMKAYAYQNPLHKEVIKLTRELGWYKEELFARFVPYKEEGTWHGKKILNAYLKH
jgi:heme-degrading monooxygenase HmoA